MKQSTMDKLEKEKESPYKKDSLYERGSHERSFDNSSQNRSSPVQTFTVKKRYGAMSGLRESPFKKKDEEEPI